MTERLRHRGPDGAGVWSEPGRRSWATADCPSWISRTPADEPMVLGPHVLTYNGEIYNHQTLRARIAGAMALDRRYGGAAAPSGAARRRLPRAAWPACLRLRAGIRCRGGCCWRATGSASSRLYYQILPDGIAFASELKALLVLGKPADRSRAPCAISCFTATFPRPKTIYQRNRQAAGRPHADLGGRAGADRALLAAVGRHRAKGRPTRRCISSIICCARWCPRTPCRMFRWAFS